MATRNGMLRKAWPAGPQPAPLGSPSELTSCGQGNISADPHGTQGKKMLPEGKKGLGEQQFSSWLIHKYTQVIKDVDDLMR